jgi:hypothetical protein
MAESRYGTRYAETEALLALIVDVDLQGCARILHGMSVEALMKLHHAAHVLSEFASRAGVLAALHGHGSRGNLEAWAGFREWDGRLKAEIERWGGEKPPEPEEPKMTDVQKGLVGLLMLGQLAGQVREGEG